jgi:hypothetical protein
MWITLVRLRNLAAPGFGHGKHRARRRADDFVRHVRAAFQIEVFTVPSAHHDQVSVLILRVAYDLFGGNTCIHGEFRLAPLVCLRRQQLFRLIQDEIQDSQTVWIVARFFRQHMQHHQARAFFPRQ